MKQEYKMTPHHWNLYNLIKTKTLEGKTLTVGEIAMAFPEVYNYHPIQSHYSNCPKLYKDIDFINSSGEIEKWITKNNNHIKLATEEECLNDLEKLKKELSRVGKMKYRLEKKMRNHRQGKILSNKNVPIEESKGRAYVETYIEKENK